MLKLAVLDDYSGVAMEMADWASLSGVAVTVFRDHLADEDALVERLHPFDIICLMRERTPMPRSLIARLDKLRMIASTGYHNPSIDLDAARERDILVTGTPRISNSTAELVLTLMLCMARNIVPQVDLMRAGGWEYGIGRCIGGTALGIVGLGNVGKRVARLAASVGMDVIAWSQNLTPEIAAAGGARHVTKHELFRQADFVSIHLKLSERTRHIVGAHELALMKPDSYLINTARAANVDMAALLNALGAKRIAGAAIDIFDEEPLPPDHPYRTTPNLIVTPHIGYVTRESMGNFYGDVVDAARAFLEGREPTVRLA
jgi:phosphoglycerate dehydrogenase-like enzyme